ncbi:hypothetical protein BDN71DRAFT_1053517 [Pleurotus eryngii]|uniref:Uncharacterized protein n=1 Tax=Pleurotus eryngii TaxID=5323 RepID=A0A9P5ZWX9_PLEER|nr:hypothetical protein BDN71DRAFT_1053517 [Pleurotus eryngii]
MSVEKAIVGGCNLPQELDRALRFPQSDNSWEHHSEAVFTSRWGQSSVFLTRACRRTLGWRFLRRDIYDDPSFSYLMTGPTACSYIPLGVMLQVTNPYEKRSRCQVGTANVQVEGSNCVQRRITQRLLATRVWPLFVLSHICRSDTDPFALTLARCSHIITSLGKLPISRYLLEWRQVN